MARSPYCFCDVYLCLAVCDYVTCTSIFLGSRIGTATGRAGCRSAEKAVPCAEHTLAVGVIVGTARVLNSFKLDYSKRWPDTFLYNLPHNGGCL